MKPCQAVLIMAALSAAPYSAHAELIFDGDVTPTMFLGPDAVNGSWTINRSNGIELALRAKVRYPVQMNVFNSNGDGTYSHDTGDINGRATWSFEFSANADYDGTSGYTLFDGFSEPAPNKLDVFLGVDRDPTPAADLLDFRIMTFYVNNEPPNHMTIAQNRDNIGLLPIPPWGFDLTQDGIYDFRLRARDALLGGEFIAETSMRVITTTPPPPPPELLGDYNEDGTVDAADYVIWRTDGINGEQGYIDWRANFGKMLDQVDPGIVPAASPEPTGLALCTIGAFWVAFVLRRSSRYRLVTGK